MFEIDSSSAPDCTVLESGRVLGDAVRGLVHGRVERVAGAVRGRYAALVQNDDAAAARPRVGHDADDRNAAPSYRVVAERLRKVLVGAAEVLVRVVDLLVADRLVVAGLRWSSGTLPLQCA